MRSESVIRQQVIELSKFDDHVQNLQYLDIDTKRFPVTDKLRNHLIMAGLSDSYKTMMFNFKINKQNGHYDEVLLVSKVFERDGDSSMIEYTVIQGQVNSVPIPKYTSYTTKKCDCVWYTLCIENKCKITTHYTPRAYTYTELSNLELAMRLATYERILINCYNNKDKFDFIGLSILTDFIRTIKLPSLSSSIQNPLNTQSFSIKQQIEGQDEEIIENEDGSIFVEDIDKIQGLFESKRQLYELAKNLQNKQLSQRKIIMNISQMKIYELSQFESMIKQMTKPIKSHQRIAIQYWILSLESSDLKWNVVQVLFNQNQRSVVTNIIFKKSIETQQLDILSNEHEYDNSDGSLEDGIVLLTQFEQSDDDVFKIRKQKRVKIQNQSTKVITQ